MFGFVGSDLVGGEADGDVSDVSDFDGGLFDAGALGVGGLGRETDVSPFPFAGFALVGNGPAAGVWTGAIDLFLGACGISFFGILAAADGFGGRVFDLGGADFATGSGRISVRGFVEDGFTAGGITADGFAGGAISNSFAEANSASKRSFSNFNLAKRCFLASRLTSIPSDFDAESLI